MGQMLKFCLTFLMSVGIAQPALARVKTLENLPEYCGSPVNRSVWTEESTYSKPQATPHSWPWHVGLWSQNRGRHPFCGGTILNDRLIITAAHCIKLLFACAELPLGERVSVPKLTGDVLTVHLGGHRFSKSEPTNQNIQADLVEVHPKFDPKNPNTGYDVALVWLTRPWTSGYAVQPICVSKEDTVIDDGSFCFYAGWGAVLRKGSAKEWKNPRNLREAEVAIAPFAECTRATYPVSKENTLCMETEARAPCHGDSGGGLYCHLPQDGRWFLYGVLGALDEKCVGDRAVSTPIISIKPWLIDTLTKN